MTAPSNPEFQSVPCRDDAAARGALQENEVSKMHERAMIQSFMAKLVGEAGEAVAAVMQMITGQRSPADARREVSEAITAFTQLAARMDADADGVA